MEVKGPRRDRETLEHGDVRLPEERGGPSRGRVFFHLAGIGLGFLLLLVGVGLGLSRNMWDKLALIPTIAGGGLVAGWVTLNYRFLAEIVRNRRVMVGTNALFLGLLGVVLLTMVNFISYRHFSKWDMTEAGLRTLSEKTRKVLDNLDRDVAVLTIHLASFRTANERTYEELVELLELYEDAGDRVSVEHLEADKDPEATRLTLSKYGIDINYARTDNVYVVSGERKKVLQLGAMMEWEPVPTRRDPYGRRPTAFKGEQYVTSAIVEVTEERRLKLYALGGHGERGVDESSSTGLMDLFASLRRDNLAVETLVGVPDGGVPDDCDCLVIMGPQARLASDELERISRYLEGGGRLLFCSDFRVESSDLADTGLESLLYDWGVEFERAVVISRAHTLYGSSTAFVTQTFGSHEITEPLRGFAVAFNFARPVEPVRNSPRSKGTAAPLVETAPTSYAERDLDMVLDRHQTRFDAGEDREGPLTVAVAVTENTGGPARGRQPQGGSEGGARIVVFGDVDVFSNQIVSRFSRNLDLAHNSVNWLLDRGELISIEPRAEARHVLVVDSAGRQAVLWFMVVGLPLGVLLLGGMVWAVRSYGSRAG